MRLSNKLFTAILVLICGTGCNDYLDVKPNAKLAVPTTVPDFQALLDNDVAMNNLSPHSGEVGSDNYYLLTADWAARPEDERRMYTWEKDYIFKVVGPVVSNDWNNLYKMVFIANTCLEGIPKVERDQFNAAAWDNVKGTALFYRGSSFLKAAFIWTGAYDGETAVTQLGISLRTTADFNEESVRANLRDTYAQILADLKASVSLLPVAPTHPIRPSKPAAYALLARTYLAMNNYDSCLHYADLCLQLKKDLLNFNGGAGMNLTSSTYKILRFNPEVIHESYSPPPGTITNARAKVDSALYLSYATNDLRKTIFFQSTAPQIYRFMGSYEGSVALFDGIATDEVYLMRAESYARKGMLTEALADLNTLMEKRWKAGSFVAFAAPNAAEALKLILQERRKELIFRSLRWMDLKRLNKEGANITLKRIVNNETYTLLPNDLRYAMAIPEDVVRTSKVVQNPR